MIFTTLLLTTLLVLAADAPKSQINPGIEADIAAIKKVREAAIAALNANDPDALVDLFTEDIVWMGDGEPTITGKGAVRAYFRPRFQQFRVEGMTISHDEVVVAGNWAFHRSTLRGKTVRLRDGEVRPFERKAGDVMRREADGSWKHARIISNNNIGGDPRFRE